MKRYFILILLFSSLTNALAIYPIIRNFSRNASNAGTQNWSIAQLKNDWMYFANNKGLLEFDGSKWSLYPIKNNTNVRSIYYDVEKDCIYAGAYNEFGLYKRDSIGIIRYTSISSHLSKKINKFTEVWNISKTKNSYFFQSDFCVFKLENDKLKQYSFDDKINYSTVVNEKMIMDSYKKGISYFNGQSFVPFPNSEVLNNKKVCSILPFTNNQILFVTDFYGIYIFNGEKTVEFKTKIDSFIKENQVFCATIKNNQLAIGTVLKGLVVLNLKDNSTIFSNIQTGLQNNTILSISFDRLNNLWLGLDKGIDYVILNSPVNNLIGNSNIVGSGYTSIEFQNQLYLGTNQGLYKMEIPKNSNSINENIELITKIKGQIWNLTEIDNQLFCSCDHGLYIINNNKIEQIDGIRGVWKVTELKSKPGFILGSTYNEFFLIKKVKNKWVFSNFLKGFFTSGNSFCEDTDGSIWFSQPVEGVFNFRINEGLDSIKNVISLNKNNGLNNKSNNTVFTYKNHVVISTENGFYTFNRIFDKIEKMPFLNKLFGENCSGLKIFQSPTGDIWFITDEQFKIAFKSKNGKYNIDSTSLNFLKNKLISGFQNIYFLDTNNVLIGTEDGFSIVNKNKLNTKRINFKIAIRSVYLTKNKTLLHTGYIDLKNNNKVPEISHKENSIRFEYVVPEFRNEGYVTYSYYLENYDSNWSEFTNVNTKEYTKLGRGSYNFRVRAKNILYSQIVETNYQFIILPAWYESKIALFIYLIILVICIFLGLKYINHRSEKGAREMEARKELELKAQEEKFKLAAKEKQKEIIELKNQRLQFDLRHKSQELASSTMNLIRKNEILQEISQNLNKVSTEMNDLTDPKIILKQVYSMQNEIKENIEHDDNWKRFAENFDLVYENYLMRLSEQFPQLTISDKKLCAYLKMDLSSKDIAPLLNITFRSVEMSRYRLRKKLNLGRDINLTDYLQNF